MEVISQEKPWPVSTENHPAFGGWLGVWATWVALMVLSLICAGLDYIWFFVRPKSFTYKDGVLISVDGVPFDGAIRDTYFDIFPREVWKFNLLVFGLFAVALLGLCVLWLQFRRSRHAPFAYICWLPTVAVFPLYLGVSRVVLQPFGLCQLPYMAAQLLAVTFIVSSVGLVYFFRSRRVRDTFVPRFDKNR